MSTQGKSMYKIISALVILLFLIACAGPNPNPGERSTDMAWTSNKFQRAFELAKPRAEAGEPWAQLRLGIFYENGWGTSKDIKKAEYWYLKGIAQKASGEWANGKVVGATGKPGYFNQNSDARIAEYNLAQLYYENGGDLTKALKHINNVINESEGKSVFFCCEFSGGRYFSQKQLVELKNKIEKKISE
jgi:TPR repeat protein